MMRADKPAKLVYCDGHFEILEPGAYVMCAFTGTRVPLDRLRYWSVDRQEPYATPEAMFAAWTAREG